MRHTRNIPRRGFTLIEALAAIAVMTIVIPVILQGFTLATTIALTTQQTADATALAQSKMEELIATQDWVMGGSTGEEKINTTIFQWDAVLGNYESEQNVQQLTVTVRWDRRGVARSVELSTIVFIPGSTISTESSGSLTPNLTPGLGGIP
jgi:prepilin-type N-terminal cleavage/methylation domain-containing protein